MSDGMALKHPEELGTSTSPGEAKQARSEGNPQDTSSPAPEFKECTAQELAKMSKEERKAYHTARIAASKTSKPVSAAGGGQKTVTKAERRALQDAQRQAKESQKGDAGEFDQLYKDLRMQGLNEDQAKQVVAEMAKGEKVDDEDDEDEDEDDDQPEDLKASVKRWMDEQETVPSDALNDFNLKVRFQGHVETTPPDHLRTILELIAQNVCNDIDWSGKVQPMVVAKKAEPALIRWAPLLEPLFTKIDDIILASDVVVCAVFEGVACCGTPSDVLCAAAAVGCLMAVREIDMIEDDDLLTGCKRMDCKAAVMSKFIEHLEDELEEDSDDDA